MRRRDVSGRCVFLFAAAAHLAVVLVLRFVVGICTPEEIANGTCPAPEKPKPQPAQLAPEEMLSDVGPHEGSVLTMGRRMVPQSPGESQKKPPCADGKSGHKPGKERELLGACYFKANPEDFQPPCEAPTLEFGGACYHAIYLSPRPGTSIED